MEVPGIDLLEKYDSEMVLIGTLLSKPHQFRHVVKKIDESAFDYITYRTIYSAMRELYNENGAFDQSTVAARLNNTGKLKDMHVHGNTNATQAGTLVYIMAQASTQFADTIAEDLLEMSKKRDFFNTMNVTLDLLKKGENTANIRDLWASTINILTSTGEDNSIDSGFCLDSVVEQMKEARDGNYVPLTFGLAGLDRIISGGFYAPQLIYIAARTGEGKTALIGTIIYNFLRKYDKKRVMFFSFEMDIDEIARRLLAMHTGVEYNAIRIGGRTAEEAEIVARGADELKQIFGDRLKLNGLDTKISKMRDAIMRSKEKPDVIFLDYAGYVEPENKGSARHLEVAQISRDLKKIAREFGVPVISAAQLNRNAVDRPGGANLADMAESGQLERDGDIVIFIRREEDKSFVDVAKQRNGATGSCVLKFVGNKAMFADNNS